MKNGEEISVTRNSISGEAQRRYGEFKRSRIMFDIIFESVNNILEELTTIGFLSLYLGFKHKGAKRYAGFFAAFLISFVFMQATTTVEVTEGILGMGYTIIYFVYAYFCLKGDTLTKLFMSTYTNSVIYLVSYVVVSIFYRLIPEYMPNQISVERRIVVIVYRIAAFMVFAAILAYKNKKKPMKSPMKTLTIFLLIVQVIILVFMYVIMDGTKVSAEATIFVVSLLFVNIILYIVFIKLCADMQQKQEYEAQIQKMESDKKYVEEVQELYIKTCSARHDLKTHFETLANLIDNKEKALEYIASVTQSQATISKALIKTDNVAFDALANAKLAICDREGIRVEIHIENKSLDRLKADEIGVIFGNLFDNAIEAAQRCDDKRILLDVHFHNERCSIVMKNTISESVLDKNQELKTTKANKDSHGYGIKNIQRITDSYGGMINFFEEDNFFGVDIII